METERVKDVLNRRFKIHKGFPFQVEFAVNEVESGIQIEAQPTVISVETDQPQKGIVPEVCSVIIPAGSSDREIAMGALGALKRFMTHEADEVTTFDGVHIVEPHA